MEFDLLQLRTLFLLLLGLMLVTLGVLVAYLFLAGRRAGMKARRQSAQEEPSGQGNFAPGSQAVSLLRLSPGRALHVEVGGARYRSFAEIEDPQLKRQVLEAAMDLVRFTGVLGVESIAPAPVDKTYSWREDLRDEIRAQGRQTPEPPASEALEERFLNLLSEIGPAPAVEKPRLAAALPLRRSPKSEQPQPPSVVDEIEAIIQRRVLLIAALAGHDLHVRQGPEGNVLFVFEGQEYGQLDDVPNLTARQLVKDAIQEWEETA